MTAPWVPPREHEIEDGPPFVPTAEELQYRQPPLGLNRRDRADWQRAEGERLADLHARAGKRSGPVKGLGRKGRRAWTAVHREHQADQRKQEYTKRSGDRSLGVLVVLCLLAVLLIWRVFFTGEDTPPPPAAQPVVESTLPAPAVDNSTAEAAVESWFTAVCGSSPDDPQTARLARTKKLMTPEAWTELDHTAPAPTATLTCGPVTSKSSVIKPGEVAVLYTAKRFVSGSKAVITIHETRSATEQPDGTWLVGPVLADH